MPTASIKLEKDGDGAWPDLGRKITDGQVIFYNDELKVAILEGGMQSGLPSVTLRFDLPDGKVLISETSLAMFLQLANMAYAKYGDAGTKIKLKIEL